MHRLSAHKRNEAIDANDKPWSTYYVGTALQGDFWVTCRFTAGSGVECHHRQWPSTANSFKLLDSLFWCGSCGALDSPAPFRLSSDTVRLTAADTARSPSWFGRRLLFTDRPFLDSLWDKGTANWFKTDTEVRDDMQNWSFSFGMHVRPGEGVQGTSGRCRNFICGCRNLSWLGP